MPFVGGSFSGFVRWNDNVPAYFGTSDDTGILHNTTDTVVTVDRNGNGTRLVVDGNLHVETTTATFRPPKMTETQRDNLTAVAGDMIYNTSDNQFEGYNGTSWVVLG